MPSASAPRPKASRSERERGRQGGSGGGGHTARGARGRDLYGAAPVRVVGGGVPGPAPRFSFRQGSRGRGARPRRARRARGRGRRRRAGAMRITPDLVAQSPQFTNPLNDREIKLRAYKIPAVENLGATQDQFDVIDLSDNEIRKLEVRCPPQQPPLPAPTGCPPRCAPAGACAFRGVLPSSVTSSTRPALSLPAHENGLRLHACSCPSICLPPGAYSTTGCRVLPAPASHLLATAHNNAHGSPCTPLSPLSCLSACLACLCCPACLLPFLLACTLSLNRISRC